MKKVLYSAVILLISCPAVWADLTSEFAGFTSVQESGVSGLQSNNEAVKLPASLFALGPSRVNYPGNVGTVPSPGGTTGAHFDEAALGVKVQGSNLIVKVASALDPQAGYFYPGWSAWYGQGDVFLTVDDSAGIRNFALLNSWAKSSTGAYLTLDGGYFDQAQEFHTGTDLSSTLLFVPTQGNLQGHLVSLGSTSDVLLTGGTGAYSATGTVAPGLDYRAFVQNGTNMGDAGLAHSKVDSWFVQTWTVPASWLSLDSTFAIGLHIVPSCGNDQIGLLTDVVVPVPGAILLGMFGLAAAGLKLRRFA